jgi:hypothetical protein
MTSTQQPSTRGEGCVSPQWVDRCDRRTTRQHTRLHPNGVCSKLVDARSATDLAQWEGVAMNHERFAITLFWRRQTLYVNDTLHLAPIRGWSEEQIKAVAECNEPPAYWLRPGSQVLSVEYDEHDSSTTWTILRPRAAPKQPPVTQKKYPIIRHKGEAI